MERKGQLQIGEEFYKFYKMETDYKNIDFIKDISATELENLRVRVNEDTDGEMRSITGSYSIEQLQEQYESMMQETLYPKWVSITFAGDYALSPILIEFHPSTKKVTLVSKNNDFELDKIVKKNNYEDS